MAHPNRKYGLSRKAQQSKNYALISILKESNITYWCIGINMLGFFHIHIYALHNLNHIPAHNVLQPAFFPLILNNEYLAMSLSILQPDFQWLLVFIPSLG